MDLFCIDALLRSLCQNLWLVNLLRVGRGVEGGKGGYRRRVMGAIAPLVVGVGVTTIPVLPPTTPLALPRATKLKLMRRTWRIACRSHHYQDRGTLLGGQYIWQGGYGDGDDDCEIAGRVFVLLAGGQGADCVIEAWRSAETTVHFLTWDNAVVLPSRQLSRNQPAKCMAARSLQCGERRFHLGWNYFKAPETLRSHLELSGLHVPVSIGKAQAACVRTSLISKPWSLLRQGGGMVPGPP